ncbi:substrate binding protein of glycine betaine ABC transport system [Saccharopolyspora erythraea NRRL 2338]|uniref:ABC transporter domain-containing protein n=1 Tax=Saccharopolyspora erythraea TaxID=1836 RepID=A0ABP3NJM8_SACER|nr:ATP-binding cassette domain-containing protein [Saccharopolyspora erythraea]PFG95808.1 substrate binding protein of glycine betaine ABC transport system [Saccharopolyspora erythraea NRRL 2338]QRK92394.1 ATP-binding cassette domain-containing protein [Saccharopolyspora erythraea]
MSEIRVENLHKIFGPNPEDATRRLRNGSTTTEDLRSEGVTAAVIDASFQVRQGETFVVMGLSGSGKSTLIRMLNGLLSPTSGHVHVDGRDITAMSRKELRLVPGRRGFAKDFPDLTATIKKLKLNDAQMSSLMDSVARAPHGQEDQAARQWADQNPQAVAAFTTP